jgi:hypothetical protein
MSLRQTIQKMWKIFQPDGLVLLNNFCQWLSVCQTIFANDSVIAKKRNGEYESTHCKNQFFASVPKSPT